MESIERSRPLLPEIIIKVCPIQATANTENNARVLIIPAELPKPGLRISPAIIRTIIAIRVNKQILTVEERKAPLYLPFSVTGIVISGMVLYPR
jgi:hypothetical protein